MSALSFTFREQKKKKKDGSMAFLEQQNQKLFTRFLKSERSAGDSDRMTYRTPGSVPFEWEIEPGKPKDSMEAPDLPPLSLPPILRAAIARPFVARQSSNSLTGKMKSLLNDKFSSSYGVGSQLTVPSEELDGSQACLRKSFSLRPERARYNETFDFALEKKRPGSKSQVLRLNPISALKTSVNEKKCSPRSILDYTSDQSSSSSPLYGSNATGSAVARAILADWSRSLDADVDSSSLAPPHCSLPPSISRKSLSGPQPPISRFLHASTQTVCSRNDKFYSGPQKNEGSFSPSKTHLATQDPTCSALEQLFPPKSVEASFFTQTRQKSIKIEDNKIENKGEERMETMMKHKLENELVEGAEVLLGDENANISAFSPVTSTFVFARYFGSGFANANSSHENALPKEDMCSSRISISSPEIIPMRLQLPAEGAEFELETDFSTGSESSERVYSPVTRTGGSSFSPEIPPLRLSAVKRDRSIKGCSSLFSSASSSSDMEAGLKSSSIGTFSSPDVAALHLRTKISVQPDVMAQYTCQKISNVLLQQVAEVEKQMQHNKRHKHKPLKFMGPSCLPICTFLGRSIVCRSKITSQHHFLDSDA